ncbi:hypothetical protein [Microterricola viridarii]|uniref:hypothetical protein n=1 Tax=Microterricola viridarii TaxID=412690 RepID=UPI000A62E730|nr:hypothetical protein [Microterricola viridarii]
MANYVTVAPEGKGEVSGIEVVVPLVGKAAAPIAGQLAAKLVKSATLRWRVARKVRASSDIQYPGRLYRRWLKQLNLKALTEPVEVGGPRLALDLDQYFSVESTWRDGISHHSSAILLVEATYDAMIALADQADADILRDHWARARHEQLLHAFSQEFGAPMRLTPSDEAQLLRRASAARRRVRLEPFGIDEEVISAAFDSLRTRVPVVAPGEVRVLIGPVGSGKSEVAEDWFLSTVDRFAVEAAATRPIWLHAREMRNDSLETNVARTMSVDALATRGASIVVDGLDEVEAALAARIVAEAKVFAGTHKKSGALLTCRPGVLESTRDHSHLEGLSQEEATLLIERVAGSARVTWSWNPLLADAVRRPFFALAAAIAIREGERPTGQADLIARLVQRALSSESAASAAVRSSEIYALLIRMAIEATRTGNVRDGLTFQERQQVRASTLVHERVADQSLEFTLPIFQQWFAAQGVLADPATTLSAIESLESFDRWRWVLAIAGIASSEEQLDSLLEQVFLWNPGAGAWLLTQIAEGHSWFRPSASAPIESENAKARLLRATRAVVSSIGPLAPTMFPINAPDDPIVLGVRTDGSQVSSGWLSDSSGGDRVIDLPVDVGPFRQEREGWRFWRSGAIPEGAEWPWLLPVDRIASSSLDLLNRTSLFGPENGVWRTESAYRTARSLIGQQSILHAPMSRELLLDRASALLQHTPEPETTLFVTGNRRIPGLDLLNLVAVLNASTRKEFGRLVPRPDFPAKKAESTWVWDIYSDEQLQRFYAETFGLACVAYDEAVSTVFLKFAWAMGTGAQGEFGVIAHLDFRGTGLLGARSPGITSAVVPLDALGPALRHSDLPAYWSSNHRAVVTLSGVTESTENWVSRHMRHEHQPGKFASSNPFARGSSYSTSVADASSHSRPASQKAANWLWADLQALNLGRGTFPQLDR